MFNVVSLNKAIEVGTVIPMEEYHGNIGRWAEDQLEENGYTINRQKGIDLTELGVEIKTRKVTSTSGHTVGSANPEDIVSTNWEDSNVRDKVQRQYRVKHNINPLTGDNLVTQAKIYDFTHEEIQSNLKESWEYGRAIIKSSNPDNMPDYIRGEGHWGYFERQENGQYQYRITHAAMTHMESLSSIGSNRLFDFG